MQVNMSLVGQPNVTVTMFNDDEDEQLIAHEVREKEFTGIKAKRYVERRNFHIARGRLGKECGRVFPV